MALDFNYLYDVTIIGGGPAGLSAAIVLGRSCRRVVVIDSGEPRNAAAHEIHGLLGHDAVAPRDLLREGRKQLARYAVEIVDDTVTAAEAFASDNDSYPTSFVVATQAGLAVKSRKLLFATGMRDRLPDLPGLPECYGYSIHHCPYCDGWEHRGKQLVAFGDRADSACGLGLMLRGWSEHVIVLTNGRSASREHCRRLSANGIALEEHQIDRLVHSGKQLQAVRFHNGRTIPAEAMFFNSGRCPASRLPVLLGCELEDDGSTPTNRRQKTNVTGVYLAGDAAGDIQFVSVAAAEGATAAVAINRELQDEDRL